ncbi:MAG: SBBP repeat-containing protein [Candidatus Kariarchaeaceae archaeon]
MNGNQELENSSFTTDYSSIHGVFRENLGQFNASFSHYVFFPDGYVAFYPSLIFFYLTGKSFNLTFQNSNLVNPTGYAKNVGYSNYIRGDQRIFGVNHYTRILYENLYDGISLEYRITPQGMKYEFLVSPFADITQIKLQYLDVDKINLSGTNLDILVSDVHFIDKGLSVWYADNEEKIACTYMMTDQATPVIQYLIESYDIARPLIIDPLYVIEKSDTEESLSIALDQSNNVLITGYTASYDFPVVNSKWGYNGNKDIFIAKYSSIDFTLLFSTFIGGLHNDIAEDIVVDPNNNIYLTGSTSSYDFPRVNSFYSNLSGSVDAFINKLSPDGEILFSSYLGGSNQDQAKALVIDEDKNIYITGSTNSEDYPTVSAYDTSYNGGTDVFVTKISSNYSKIEFSTYIGGTDRNGDGATSIALDSENNILLTGWTLSDDYPVSNAFQSIYKGGVDAFVSKLSASGLHLLYSTYIGGNGMDFGESIVVDDQDNAHLTGYTGSSNFPQVNQLNMSLQGPTDAFILKFSTDGFLQFSSLFGGSGDEFASDISLNSFNQPYIIGTTNSIDLAIFNQISNSASYDVFITRFTSNGPLTTTILGGEDIDLGNSIIVDANQNVYITGYTNSSNFLQNHSLTSFDESNKIYVVKLSSDGHIDASFIGGEKVKLSIFEANEGFKQFLTKNYQIWALLVLATIAIIIRRKLRTKGSNIELYPANEINKLS